MRHAAVVVCAALLLLATAALATASPRTPRRVPVTSAGPSQAALLVRSGRDLALPPPDPAGNARGDRLLMPAAPPGWSVRGTSLVVDGRSRYYLVARPDRVTAANLPVLVVLHGRGMTPAGIEQTSGFLGVVGQAVVVYPAGFGASWNAGYCCGLAHGAGIDDVAFLQAVIHSVLASQPGTSARQVYLAGFSNGGRMAYDMACADPGAFAGIAAVEAVAVSTCDRSRPVPIIQIASTGDPLLSMDDQQRPKLIAGHVEVTVDDLVAHWRALDGCHGSSAVSSFGRMSLTQWSDCRAGGRVALAVYRGGRHSWPAASPGTPAAQTVIWDLFRGDPVTSGPWQNSIG